MPFFAAAGLNERPRMHLQLPPQLEHGDIAGLDGLRAISILLVLLSHFGLVWLPGGAALGVTIFFFISGFLITVLFVREFGAHHAISIPRFYLRRILRLGPELLALMLISGIVGVTYAGIPKVIDVLAGLFYFSNYYVVGAFSDWTSRDIRWTALWSLAVEEHFYLTYPLILFLLIATPRRFLVFLASTCVIVLVWRCIVAWRWGNFLYNYRATETRIDTIMFGCICALLLCRFGPRIRDLIRRSGPALAAVALALLAVTLAIRDPFFRATIRDSIQGLALCLAFFFFYGCSRGERVTRLLDSGAMRWMGKRSYAAYLWNFELALAMTALGFAPATQSLPLRILLAIALVAATFGIAHLSYRFVYQPFAPLRRRFGSHHDVGVKDIKTSSIGLAEPATPATSQIGA